MDEDQADKVNKIRQIKSVAHRDRVMRGGDDQDQASEEDLWAILEGKTDQYAMHPRWHGRDRELLRKHVKEVLWVVLKAAEPVLKKIPDYGSVIQEPVTTSGRIFREVFDRMRLGMSSPHEWHDSDTREALRILGDAVVFVLETDSGYSFWAEEFILAMGYYAPILRRELVERNPKLFRSMKGPWRDRIDVDH